LARILDENSDALFLNVLAEQLPDVWKVFDKKLGGEMPIQRAVGAAGNETRSFSVPKKALSSRGSGSRCEILIATKLWPVSTCLSTGP
jgi:hypothetical protein